MALATGVETRILCLHRDNDESWAYVPLVCQRLRDFCTTYASEADPEQVIRLYQQQFLQDTPQLLVIVALQEGRIVAHLLVSLDWWMGARLATVLQYAQDTDDMDLIPREQLHTTFTWLRQWAKAQGAGHLQCLVRHPALVRAFRQYGFAPAAMLLRQSVEEA